ncbi:hypothetical protein ANN_10045 [Periplaneta americana]|uniref:Uncharacterized protein n=1 Tax=Periplaneta americana TaxID=6978 RepID=A0ABQ8TMZ3_PERAM|nr:hypothetical protein ANN_10045 [Periplaneta americana]
MTPRTEGFHSKGAADAARLEVFGRNSIINIKDDNKKSRLNHCSCDSEGYKRRKAEVLVLPSAEDAMNEKLQHMYWVFCRKGELLRIDSHNTIRSMITDEIRRAGNYETYEEIGCLSADESTRRADIIVIDRKKFWEDKENKSKKMRNRERQGEQKEEKNEERTKIRGREGDEGEEEKKGKGENKGEHAMVNMWTPQQKVQCVLWLAEEKSVTRVQHRVRTWIGGTEHEEQLPGQTGHPI